VAEPGFTAQELVSVTNKPVDTAGVDYPRLHLQ
jgi:hypothetical protein